jgi:hypothetical protein
MFVYGDLVPFPGRNGDALMGDACIRGARKVLVT